MSDTKTISFGGLNTLIVILTIVFVVAKLMGKLDWSWLTIFLPAIIYFGITLTIVLLILLFILGVFILKLITD